LKEDFKDKLDVTFPIYRKNGIKIWVHSYGRRFNFLGKLAIFTLTKFLSTFKKTTVMKGNLANLEDHLVDKTMKLEFEQNLTQLNTRLQQINKLKTELLYRVSHELKTPLISVKGYTNLILTGYKGKLDKEMIPYLEGIMEGSERLEKLINELLESTRLEENKTKLNIREGDLTSLVKHTLEQLNDAIKMRNHSIILNLNDRILTKFDKEKIQKIVSNLLVNAIKYTPKKGQIEINSDIVNNEVIISIKDNGIGLTSEEQNQLFKQFGKIERYGKGLDVDIDGVGFGLHISRKIIELHNGKIWVESEGKNKGSTFYFSIPMI
jgi:signal transduction histidine kinase